MMIRKRKSKILIFLKQCYLIVWSAEKRQKVKPKSWKDRKGRKLVPSKRVVSDSKKLQISILKEQETSGLLTSLLGAKSPFERVPVLVSIL